MLLSGKRRSVRRSLVLPASERATGLVTTRLTAVRARGDVGADGALRGRDGKVMCLSPGGGEPGNRGDLLVALAEVATRRRRAAPTVKGTRAAGRNFGVAGRGRGV